jgi:cytochrome P450
MVVAGHETVAAGLAWTLMLLAQHPDAQDRLRGELGRHPLGVPMVGAAGSAPWLHAVLHESLRLYPPAWVVSRRSTRPDVLSGVQVPAGTMAIISPWLVHRRPSSWPRPEAFRPERFLDGQGTTARPDYIPFGLGPRLCIGREFALGEMAIVLGEVLSQFSVALPEGAWRPPAPQALLAVHPTGGMPLRVSPHGSRMAHGGAAA